MSTFIHGILSFIMYLANFILTPLNALIENYLPNFDYLLSCVSDFFTYISNLIPWVVSYFGLSHEILELILSYLVFNITLPVITVSIKFAIKWYNSLKT